jgi:hypothetical protein
MRPVFAWLVALCVVVLGGHAEAADSKTCDGYVERMRQLSSFAQKLKCGFWEKFDPAMSRRWCARVKLETITETRTTDNHKVNKCAMCRAYADAADAAARENELLRCGFTGPAWGHGDGTANDGHFQFCMSMAEQDHSGFFTINISLEGIKTSRLDPETDARNAALASCRAKVREKFSQDEVSKCEDYANKAVGAAQFNEKKHCGATVQGRWTLNKEEHFLWCLPRIGNPEGKAEVASEQEIRTTGVDTCKKGDKISADGRPFIKHLGKRKPGSGGSSKSIAGASPPGDKKGSAMRDPAGSAGISTSRSAPDAMARDPMNRLGGGSMQGGSFGSGGSNTIRNTPPTPPMGGAGTPTPQATPSTTSGGFPSMVGSGALDRGVMAPRGLPAGSNSGTR